MLDISFIDILQIYLEIPKLLTLIAQLLKYFIDAALPGLNQSDIEVRINDNILTIKGKKEEHFGQKERDYHGGYYGFFRERSFMLPSNIVSGNVNAKFENGILHIKYQN